MTESTQNPVRCGVAALVILVLLGVSGFAHQPGTAFSLGAPGFWLGVLHGFIAPFSLLASLFANYRMYAVPNSGVLYDLGFLLGLSAWGGGGTYFAKG